MFPRKARCILAAILAASVCYVAPPASGYSLNGYHWTDGTQILMHLGLVHAQPPLEDGSASWNDSAADALAIWNGYVPKVAFAATDAAAATPQDGVNSVVFSSDVYGEAWGTTTLAVTLYFHSGSLFTETDVLFNDHRNWNSYRGPLEGSGANATYDFHRVALHEFGHVLGLDHPDQHGQAVEAIMNSITSDLDHLADDDIAGGRVLYGFKITSPLYPQLATSGTQFTYQIKADSHPISYSATGLPPELQLDPNTGLISGRCYSVGTFQVTVEADEPRGPAVGKFSLTINPQGLTSTYYPNATIIGDSFSYRIMAANNPTSFTATGLPAGLTIDPNTGLISGTPTAAGYYSVNVTAVGPTSIAGGTISIQILPPQITSLRNFVSLEIGDSFVYQITATNSPLSYSASGFPAEFQLNPTTGLITGTASTPGNYSVTVKAQTSFGEASASFPLIILSPHLTSANSVNAQVGTALRYVTTASNHPTSFSSGALPPGLQFDSSTGELTGTPTLSGTYSVKLTAHGAVGDAPGSVSIYVQSVPSYSPPIASSPVSSGAILSDPTRARFYVADASGFKIVDSSSLAVIKAVPLQFGTARLDLSADGSTIYFTAPSSQSIKRVNAETLDNLPDVRVTAHKPFEIVAGADGYLYITDANSNGSIYQIDPNTGNDVTSLSPVARTTPRPLTIKATPDHKTLFVAEQNYLAPALAKYTLSSGSAPRLAQLMNPLTPDSVSAIAVSPDGTRMVAITRAATAQPQPNIIRSTGDLNTVLGSIPAPFLADDIVFSFDGFYVAQSYQYGSQYSGRVDTIRLSTGAIERSTTLPTFYSPISYTSRPSLAVDSTSSRFFLVAGQNGNSTQESVFQYALHGPPVPPKTLMNVSTRLQTHTGDNVLIGGFIIEGANPKRVIVRAIGPSLKAYGVTGSLADPALELHAADGRVISSSDNWNEHRLDVLGSNMWPADEHESAIVATLEPGAYTAILRGVNETTGVALVEFFDLDPSSGSRITNLSTRGKVETGDNVMIGGFIIAGDQPTKVIVRAVGPSLTQYGVAGALDDSTLDLFDGSGAKVASNDDWASDQGGEIVASGHPPSDPREAAIVRTLPPGSYTAIVRGKNNSTGVALVEIYNLEPAAN